MVITRHKLPLALSWLVVLVMVFRSVIPAGFMPGQGTVPLVICTGSGPATVYVPADKAPISGEHTAGDQNVCPFSIVFAQGILAFVPALSHMLVSPEARFYLPAFLLPAVAFKPYSAQGPPAA